jgi:hypothetical protein
MPSPNRARAKTAFHDAFQAERAALLNALHDLRMDMLRYPATLNTEPQEAPSCEAPHARGSQTIDEWHVSQVDREACPTCKAATASYWAREAWRKTRGDRIRSLRYCLTKYRNARAIYWRSGGFTSMGADHSSWEGWKV